MSRLEGSNPSPSAPCANGPQIPSALAVRCEAAAEQEVPPGGEYNKPRDGGWTRRVAGTAPFSNGLPYGYETQGETLEDSE